MCCLWFNLLLLRNTFERVKSYGIFKSTGQCNNLILPTCLRRQHVMIFEREFHRLTLLSDDVVDALHYIAHCEIHSVCLAQSLTELSCRCEKLSCFNPLRWALIYQVSK